MTLASRLVVLDVKSDCRVYCLGKVEYSWACRLQERLHEARRLNLISDSLLILQHPPVLTVGKSGHKPEHLLASPETLEAEGISICRTNRGGGITYHGPGQLVCYPIFDLHKLGLTVRQYINKLEEVVIGSLAYLNVEAHRLSGTPGLWVADAEISSIGIYVSHGVTMHGFTINVNNDLKPFSYIAACGVAGKKMTTVSRVCGAEIPAGRLIPHIIESFARVFALDIVPGHSVPPEEYDE